MKTRTFEVPIENMAEVAEIIGDNELENSIQGINDDEEIIIEIRYSTEDRRPVFEIMDLLEPDDDQDDD